MINVFCKHSERAIRLATTERKKKRVIGMLVILISHMLQNSKVMNNKKAKELVKEFLSVYLINSSDNIGRLFVERPEFTSQQLDMSVQNFDYRRKDRMKDLIKLKITEMNVKDICFYNHVVSSYLLIISNILISIEKENESKKLALKCLSEMFRGQIHYILKLCTTNRLTNTGEIMSEFTEILAGLAEEKNLDYDGNQEFQRSMRTISEKEDLLINVSQLQHISSSTNLKNDSHNYKQNAQYGFRKNLNMYGRSYVLDRNEMFYMLKS